MGELRMLKEVLLGRPLKKVQMQGGAPGTHPGMGAGARRTRFVRRSAA